MRRNQPERELQVAYFKWICQQNNQRMQLIHSTGNGNYKNIVTAKKAKEEGMLAGVWDVFFPYPAYGKSGLWIEFKSPIGRLTKEQKWFQKSLEDFYAFAVVKTLEEAIDITENWFEDY